MEILGFVSKIFNMVAFPYIYAMRKKGEKSALLWQNFNKVKTFRWRIFIIIPFDGIKRKNYFLTVENEMKEKKAKKMASTKILSSWK